MCDFFRFCRFGLNFQQTDQNTFIIFSLFSFFFLIHFFLSPKKAAEAETPHLASHPRALARTPPPSSLPTSPRPCCDSFFFFALADAPPLFSTMPLLHRLLRGSKYLIILITNNYATYKKK